ncbi:MAG: peptidylprolyl isomerase [Polyangiaceae bacterium]|nr:peptidylprolyl isomerase [Polyangiaceae bacterium]
MNRLSQLLGAAAVIAIAVVFIVQFRPATNAQTQGAGITCAVEIRGSCVQSTDFWAAYRLLAPRNADASRLRAMGLRRIAAEGLYERWLLNEDAKRLGITVSDDDVTSELVAGRVHVSLPADKMRQVGYSLGLGEDPVRYLLVRNPKTKKFDNKSYEREVRTWAKMSPPDFRDFQRKELIAARMRDLIRARVRVGENEAFDQFSREKSTRTIDYVRFDRRFYADLIVDASDKAVDAWAFANKDELDKTWEARKPQFLPECRVTRHVLARFDPTPEDAEADKQKAKEKAQKALDRIKKGDDFADVAREMSDDSSAPRGGELGCVAKGRMVKPFEDKVFELKAGEVSDLVETEYGFHVIKVEQIAKDADAEKVGRLQTARELYVSHESERLAAEGAKQVLAAIGGGKPMKEALDAYVATLTPAKAAGGDKAKKGEKKKADDKGKAADVEQEGAAEKNAAPTIAAHPHRPSVETSLPFNASGDPLPSAKAGTDATRIAFELEKPGDVPRDVVPLETGYAVVQLKEKTPATQEQWEKEREYYVSAMRAAKQNDALIGYLRRLRATIGSEVKYDQSLITESKDKDSEAPEPVEEEGE